MALIRRLLTAIHRVMGDGQPMDKRPSLESMSEVEIAKRRIVQTTRKSLVYPLWGFVDQLTVHLYWSHLALESTLW